MEAACRIHTVIPLSLSPTFVCHEGPVIMWPLKDRAAQASGIFVHPLSFFLGSPA